MILVQHRLNHCRLHLFNKKVCLHRWTFGIKEKDFFLDFLNFLIGLHFLWYTNLFWSGRCCFSLVFVWALLLLSCSGVDVAVSLTWEREGGERIKALWSDWKYEIANFWFPGRIIKRPLISYSEFFFKSKIFF